MQNHSYENDFDLHENETACRTHFHMKGFALRLALKQRHKRTRKWPVDFLVVIMASGIARGRVRTTAATTVKSRKMAAILPIIG